MPLRAVGLLFVSECEHYVSICKGALFTFSKYKKKQSGGIVYHSHTHTSHHKILDYLFFVKKTIGSLCELSFI